MRVSIVFNSLKSQSTSRYIPINKSQRSRTRSNSILSFGILRYKKNDSAVFMKLSKCVFDDRLALNKKEAQSSPAQVETRMYNVTNRLNYLGVCKTYVFCYNKYLRSTLYTKQKQFRTLLITENINKFIRFDTFIKHATHSEIRNILFQLLYTLQCMNTIRMTHTDLHFKNMYVQKRVNLKKLNDRYIFKEGTGYNTVEVSCLHQLKIIDLDGAHKHSLQITKSLRMMDLRFIRGISNKHMFWGKTRNVSHQFDLMKFIFHLHQYRPDIRHLLVQLGCVNNKNLVPFYDFIPKTLSPFGSAASKYGMFYDKHGDFIKLNDTHLHRPKKIIATMSSTMSKKVSTHVHDTFSQKNLYIKK